MLEKNQVLKGIVETIGSNGEGIVRENKIPIFVPYALPGEKITYKILKVQKNYAYGKVLEVHTPAEDRIIPPCPVFFQCGGCQLQHVRYKWQKSWKATHVKECLRKIAHIDTRVLPVHSGARQFGYRNKLQLAIGVNKEGNTVFGFYAENSHRIVPIESCLIHPEWSAAAIDLIKKYVEKTGVRGYDEQTREGQLRHFIVRDVRGKFIVTIVSATANLPDLRSFYKELKSKFLNVTLYVNVNAEPTNVILGKEFHLIAGDARPIVSEGGFTYEVGPESFLQVNDSVRKALYADAIRVADTNSDTVVIDAYSGAGMMTAKFAKCSKIAYGIECVQEAVDCADQLAEMNGLTHRMKNICGACEDVLPDLIEKVKGEGSSSVVILDPPRKGCDKLVLQALLRAKPDKIIYISCNPSTLARDLGILLDTLSVSESGLHKNINPNSIYQLDYVKPYDMFPQTKHVESVVCLTRKKDI